MAGGAGGFPVNPPKGWNPGKSAEERDRMAFPVPKNYKEVLVREAQELLRLCEALNGGKSEDEFQGDRRRLRQDIIPRVGEINVFAEQIWWVSYDRISDPIQLTL